MALGINYEPSAGGDFMPIVKYDARSGTIFRVDRGSDGKGGWQTDQVNITQAFKAVMDLEHIEAGWISFKPGSTPDIRTLPLDQKIPDEPPSEHHKHGFRIILKLASGCAEGKAAVRELASNSKAASEGMDILHNAYLTERSKHPGELPIVIMTGTVGKTSTGGGMKTTNYMPRWEIGGWCKRPDDLIYTPRQQASSTAPQQQAPASTGSTTVNTKELAAQSNNVVPMKGGDNANDFG